MKAKLASIVDGEPSRCKKPKKTRSRSKKARARAKKAAKAYKKCRSIKSAFIKQKKNEANFKKRCLVNCSRCIEDCTKPNEQVFDNKGKCRQPSLREKLTKSSAKAAIVRNLV